MIDTKPTNKETKTMKQTLTAVVLKDGTGFIAHNETWKETEQYAKWDNVYAYSNTIWTLTDAMAWIDTVGKIAIIKTKVM